MKYKSLIKKLKLSDSDFEKIKKSVQEVETKTTGEISVAIAPESAHYSFWELLASNTVACIALIIMLGFSDKIRNLYERFYWQNEPDWILPAFFVISCFSIVVLVFYLANIPFIDRVVIPRSVRKVSVTNRALRYFTESGVYKTAEHSGILIFASYMERQVRIIADEGISEKISPDLWNLIADEFAEELKNGNVAEAFVQAILKCGDLLAENFPAKKENPNELTDGLVILEDAEWF
ncbi:MAG: hypothetical protein GX677_03390 [Treponema sp.]|nr:hypothetical protein [Treponema sp.]